MYCKRETDKQTEWVHGCESRTDRGVWIEDVVFTENLENFVIKTIFRSLSPVDMYLQLGRLLNKLFVLCTINTGIMTNTFIVLNPFYLFFNINPVLHTCKQCDKSVHKTLVCHKVYIYHLLKRDKIFVSWTDIKVTKKRSVCQSAYSGVTMSRAFINKPKVRIPENKTTNKRHMTLTGLTNINKI